MSSDIRQRIKQDWSEQNEKRYKWIYNKLKEGMNGFNYDIKDYLLKMNKPKLLTFINKLDIGDGSKESMFFTVSKYLQLNDSKNPNILKFQQAGHKLLDKSKKKEGENLIDEDKKEAYESQEYFLKIINDIDYKKINNIIEHNNFLLLSLLIFQPPLRTNFYSSCILTNSNKATSKPDDKNNYLLLKNTMGKDRAYYIVGNDKVSNSKQFKMDPTKNIIEIEDPKLIQILNDSFKRFPRRFLFENAKGGQVSEESLRTYLRNITKLPQINFDIMRSVYISHAYNTTAKTVNQREKLAVKMRHSTGIAARSYFKIKPDDNAANNKDNNELLKEIKQQKETITALNIQVNELKAKLLETVQPVEGDKLFNKRKSDILARIKKGLNVKPETLKKYNLEQPTK